MKKMSGPLGGFFLLTLYSLEKMYFWMQLISNVKLTVLWELQRKPSCFLYRSKQCFCCRWQTVSHKGIILLLSNLKQITSWKYGLIFIFRRCCDL